MATGKIIQITRAQMPGKDVGIVQDLDTGAKYRFEAIENAYKFSQEVIYESLDKTVEPKHGGMVRIRRTGPVRTAGIRTR